MAAAMICPMAIAAAPMKIASARLPFSEISSHNFCGVSLSTITKHSHSTITPMMANRMEPKNTAGFSHSMPNMVSLLSEKKEEWPGGLHLCPPPPLEKPPYEPPLVRELLLLLMQLRYSVEASPKV